MANMVIIEPTELYNLLNQGTVYPELSDQNYLLLLDARNKEDYGESHVITAKKVSKDDNGNFTVPPESELECKQYVVVYDSNTQSLKEDGPAIRCAKMLWEMGSRNPVQVLKGGYEDFSALYPFLRTQTIMYTPGELDSIKTYPTEIIPGELYLGNWMQGNTAYIQKDLKIKGHINCCVEKESFFREEGQYLLHIPAEDSLDCDLYSNFPMCCKYIDEQKERHSVVLVFSKLGISRSAAVVIAYLIHFYKWSLKEAYEHAKKCCVTVQPNRAFIEQLSKWEEDVHKSKLTDITEPKF